MPQFHIFRQAFLRKDTLHNILCERTNKNRYISIEIQLWIYNLQKERPSVNSRTA